MSYTRYHESGHYIFGGNDYVDFNGRAVPDDEIDVFIYKLYGYLKDGDEEFWERFLCIMAAASLITSKRESALKN